MLPGGYTERPHPADLCLAVWGNSRAQLYRHAALALFETLGCTVGPGPQTVNHEIHLTAPDPETLLVDWLSELLYESERQQACWQRYTLHHVTTTVLQATALGIRPARPQREVKAVTYTGLEIVEDMGGRWTATITFDV
ncbi:MAG: archease [Chloroflexi bacterium]|nr:archease [Chloroflexota bacterium]